MRRLFRHYGLSIVLGLLFLAAWIGQLVANYQEFVDEELAHGESPALGDFMAYFWGRTFENWQSEWLQLLTFVVLTAYLYHRGSHESKDSDEAMQASLDRVEQRLTIMDEHLHDLTGQPPPDKTRELG
jgi:hypothetical protein